MYSGKSAEYTQPNNFTPDTENVSRSVYVFVRV